MEVEGAERAIDELVEAAFQYRGDVTVVTDDGRSLTGYLFNRDARAREPFVQMFEAGSGDEVSIPYRVIVDVLLTGRDAAAVSARRFEVFQQKSAEQSGTGEKRSRSQAE